MTDQATTAAESNGQLPVRPTLLHSGVYTLYETPDGGRHLSYRPTMARDETGELGPAVVEDQHLPDIPPAALGLINSFLQNGFPPAVLNLLGGKMSPMKIMQALKDTGLGNAE